MKDVFRRLRKAALTVTLDKGGGGGGGGMMYTRTQRSTYSPEAHTRAAHSSEKQAHKPEKYIHTREAHSPGKHTFTPEKHTRSTHSSEKLKHQKYTHTPEKHAHIHHNVYAYKRACLQACMLTSAHACSLTRVSILES